jgi:hypothetical protein
MSHSHHPPQIQHLIHIIKHEGIMFLRLSVMVNRQFVFGIIGTHNSGALLVMFFVQFFYLQHYGFLNS